MLAWLFWNRDLSRWWKGEKKKQGEKGRKKEADDTGQSQRKHKRLKYKFRQRKKKERKDLGNQDRFLLFFIISIIILARYFVAQFCPPIPDMSLIARAHSCRVHASAARATVQQRGPIKRKKCSTIRKRERDSFFPPPLFQSVSKRNRETFFFCRPARWGGCTRRKRQFMIN